MQSFPECEEYKSDSEIVLKENKSKIIFLNPEHLEILVVSIDGCVIKEGLRCDYMLLPNQNVEIYIELKGSDVSHAVKQLESTILKLSDNVQSKNKLCFVISTRCPKLSTEIQQLKTQFKKKFNANLQIKNIVCTHNLGTSK
jgi:DNA-binding protein